jgi:predicted AlkP superfamily pyrophosphatase or phosphodiesterase
MRRIAGAGVLFLPAVLAIAACGRTPAASTTGPAAADGRAVLLVSIDGIRRGDLDDPAHALPTLRRLAGRGAVARSLVSVWPSVTYPAHTTMVTGVSPARHGITNNVVFDPFEKNDGGWYWYASAIRAETLWDAARSAGIHVANVTWPVTVGASIRYNLPQFWRAKTIEDDQLLAALSTPGLVTELRASGRQIPGEHRPDRDRAQAAAMLIATHRPRLTLLYLCDLDAAEHEAGPGSAKAWEVLERTDALLGEVVAVAERTFPRLAVVVVSDHGFAPIARETRPNVALRRAGLLESAGEGKDTKVTSYRAVTWKAGGSAAIVPQSASDLATRDAVTRIAGELAADPESGVAAVLDGREVERAGGFPGALVVLQASPGWQFSERSDEPLTVSTRYKGTHGWDPNLPAMKTVLILSGDGIAPGAALGDVPMIDVAPTVAALLGVPLRGAQGRPLEAALAR